MNILLAIVLLTTVYMVHYEYPAVYDEPPVIGWVLKDTAAAKAGFEIGDRITHIDDVKNPTWEQVQLKEALSPGQPLDVTVDRNGKTLEKTVVPEAAGVDQIGYAGWAPKEDTVTIVDLQEDMPAEKAGLKEGDKILAARRQAGTCSGGDDRKPGSHEGQADHAHRASERRAENIYASAGSFGKALSHRHRDRCR